jgi:hypothetical protein
MAWLGSHRTGFLVAGAAVAGLAFTGAATSAAVDGQLGVLDPTATNPTLQQGDQYRLTFVVSADNPLDPNDKSIGDFNSHIQSVADGAGIGGATWNVLGSTASVNAQENTSTDPNTDGPGEPIFATDGTTKIADDYADLWDGDIDNAIQFDENGDAIPSDSSPNFARFPYTGTNADGTPVAGQELGVGDDGQVRAASGTSTDSTWMNGGGNFTNNTEGSYYALSEPLTVVPEPASAALLGLGGLMVLPRRRRRA